MHQAKISVIIPCYNVEEYLDECIESVVKQTLKEIEVICVDDGSSDGTGDMLDLRARKHCNLKVLHKQNGGLSKARNTGLDAASGKYVLFLDSDDFLLKENVLELLYDKAVKENLDQLFYGTEVIFQNELVREENLRYVEYYKYNKKYSDVYNGKDLFVMLSDNSDFKVNACMQLFSRKFLLEHNLRFYEGIYHEDEVFSVQCISLAKRVSCLHEALYGRRIRENSIMTQKSKQKNVLGYCKGTQVLCEFAKENNFYIHTIFYEKYVKRLGILLSLASKLFNNMDTEYQEEILKELDEEYRIWIEVGLQQRKRIDELIAEVSVLKKEISKKNSEYKVLFEAKRDIEGSKSYKVGRIITWFPRILKRKILFRKSRKIWLIGTPEFGNLGDHCISESEILFLKQVFPNCELEEITMNDFYQHLDVLKRKIGKKDLLFFHGGGNIGNLWPKSEYIRREAFKIWRKNIKIVLPQSIFFTDDDEGKKELAFSKKAYFGKKVILICREELSYKFAKKNFDCEILLTPDMVMYNTQSDLSAKYNRKGALLCLRKDKEKKLTENEVEQIKKCLLKRFNTVTFCDTVLPKSIKVQERALELENFFKQLAQSQIVFTDRLHGMVFCALTGTPCVVYPNSYHKVECCAEWLKKLGYIRVIHQIDDFAEAIDYVTNEKQRNYDICNLRNEFEQLKDLLINL